MQLEKDQDSSIQSPLSWKNLCDKALPKETSGLTASAISPQTLLLQFTV